MIISSRLFLGAAACVVLSLLPAGAQALRAASHGRKQEAGRLAVNALLGGAWVAALMLFLWPEWSSQSVLAIGFLALASILWNGLLKCWGDEKTPFPWLGVLGEWLLAGRW